MLRCRTRLRALLALILPLPPTVPKLAAAAHDGHARIADPTSKVLETVLGMALLPDNTQALPLLNTLAAQQSCAVRLAEPLLFDSILGIVRIQTDCGHGWAVSQALRVVDAIMLHCTPSPQPP